MDTSFVLKIRENWKYLSLNSYFEENNFNFEFEYKLGNYVFDLYLKDYKLLVEFDGPDHQNSVQKIKDKCKENFAKSLGFSVLRIEVEKSAEIPINVIDKIEYECQQLVYS